MNQARHHALHGRFVVGGDFQRHASALVGDDAQRPRRQVPHSCHHFAGHRQEIAAVRLAGGMMRLG
jgi:hypothetical protein